MPKILEIIEILFDGCVCRVFREWSDIGLSFTNGTNASLASFQMESVSIGVRKEGMMQGIRFGRRNLHCTLVFCQIGSVLKYLLSFAPWEIS